jgi:dolichyldiphosphatase
MLGKGYGMPSSHAQFITFFSVSVTLFLLVRHRPTPHPPNSPHTPLSMPVRLALSAGVLAGAALVALSRVYLTYHTPKQVAVGALAGATYAVAWFLATETLLRRSGLLDWILDSEVVRLFRVRDLIVSEDLAEGGWQRWLERREALRSEARRSETKKAR